MLIRGDEGGSNFQIKSVTKHLDYYNSSRLKLIGRLCACAAT